MSRKFYLISYDVRHPGRRRKIARVLDEWRYGGQRSVAECWLSLSELAQLQTALCEILKSEVDRLVILRHDDRSRDLAMGTGCISTEAFLIVG